MKKFVLLFFLLTITSSIFSKDAKIKEISGNDLVCKQIRIIAGDNSPAVKLIESFTDNQEEGGFASALGAVIRCENATSICYAISSTMTCHKK
ncbi:hypothetical protein [Leptospira ryugenii]|uniref:hypothetical protein n=1 Tax=Leptospira ryugenii TaxID=1917863 RepID=UPI000D591266|nr:hypothetical protein [Leptospira ryugenii]